MKILDRYLVSELATPFLIGIAGFVMIMTVDLLFTFVDMIINKGVPTLAIIRLVLYKLPAIMVLTFPVSFLFATAIVLGKISRENELSAMRTSGISFYRIGLPVLVMSFVVSIAAFFTNELLVPYSNRVADDIIRQIIYKQPLVSVKEQQFFRDNNNRVFYVGAMDDKRSHLENVMIYDTSSVFPRIITAKTADIVKDKWQLAGGSVHNIDENGQVSYSAKFAKMSLDVSDDVINFSKQESAEEMTSTQLGNRISSFKKAGVDVNALSTDFHMKFSIPATTLVFTMLSIPLSIPGIRAGKSWGFVLSVVIVFTFYVFASVFRSMGRGGLILPFLAAWIPPLLVFSLGSILFYREGKN